MQVDPQLLLQRLSIACNRSDDLKSLFRYELCSYPVALFASSLTPRQPQKPVLAYATWAKLSSNATSGPEGDVQYVLDGGALPSIESSGNLSRYLWIILQLCGQEVRKRYRRFDGYDDMSTKKVTHQRRAAGKAGATVTFTENMKVTLKKDNFPANPKNKQRFINMLSRFLQEDNCPTYHAEGDADVLIVKTAVESARKRNTVTVLVGDDTDLIVLLCFYTRSDSFDLYFKPEPKANSRRRVWNIKGVKEQSGDNVCHDLFLHAILGCDTTFRVHGIGKEAALKKYANSLHFREQAKVFNSFSTVNDNE